MTDGRYRVTFIRHLQLLPLLVAFGSLVSWCRMRRRRQRPNRRLHPEYDFSKRVRGKHYRELQQGHTVKIHKADGTTTVQHFKLERGAVLLAPDVMKYFPDSDSVNHALRTLIGLLPEKQRCKA